MPPCDDYISAGAGNDDLSGGKGRDFLADVGGPTSNDVYRFERGSGADAIVDSNGPEDVANLRAYSRSEIAEVWNADLGGGMFGISDGLIDSRVIEFEDGSIVAFVNYYYNTPTGSTPLVPGTGFVERIELKDGNVAATTMNAMAEEASTRE